MSNPLTEIPAWAGWFVFMALIGGPMLCVIGMIVLKPIESNQTHD